MSYLLAAVWIGSAGTVSYTHLDVYKRQAKKSAFTGSAKVVGTEKLEQSQVTNVTDALAGAVPRCV